MNEDSLASAGDAALLAEADDPRATSSSGAEDAPEIPQIVTSTGDDAPRSEAKSRKRAPPHPKCPVCGITLSRENFDAHYALELAAFRDPGAPGGSHVSGDQRRREAASHARLTITPKLRDVDELDIRVRNRGSVTRIQRGSEKRRGQYGPNFLSDATPQPNPKRPRMEIPGIEETVQQCFVCEEILPNDPAAVNAHVDACLAALQVKRDAEAREAMAATRANNISNRRRKKNKRGQRDHDAEAEVGGGETYEEYTWGDETRVRVSTMVEHAPSGTKRKVQEDTDEDISIDGDDATFGSAQYSMADLVRMERGDDNGEDVDIDDEPPAPARTTAAGSSAPIPGHELIINALREKLRQTEAQLKNQSRCLICLDPHQDPVVSITCWHVFCEGCWMRTLGAIKLCPQCNVITNPTDLRRIYL